MFIKIARAPIPKCFRFLEIDRSYSKYSKKIPDLLKIQSSKKIISKENFKLVYEFRYIKYTVFFIRLKYIFPPSSVFLISLAFALDSTGKSGLTTFGLCLVQWVILIGASRILKNVIGKVYVNKEGDLNNIIISSVNEKGSRVDNCHMVKDLSHVVFESKKYQMMGMASVFFKNFNSYYKMFTSPDSYKIHDPYIIKSLFGSEAFFNASFIRNSKKNNT